VHISPEIPPILAGDEQRLAQVVANLLTNAVKFTDDGGSIHLEAKLVCEEEGMCTLHMSVKDTGIGISAEQQSRLFNAFTQADSNTSRKYGGTGLGLVISRNIVEMMDGHMWVDSELGQGSTFNFTVCLARGKEDQKRRLNPNVNLSSTRMLAVDDNLDILEFFKESAKLIGITCDTAANGSEALQLVAANGTYDIYFVDWKMPGMDGVELTRAIRADGSENAVIIMISAMDWSAIQDAARSAGINKFIPKPLFVSSLMDCINDYLGVPEGEIKEQTEENELSFAGHCILLAEDVEINREIVAALLEPFALEIDFAENGVEAVAMFGDNPDKYGMIFMDVQMPEMDGYEATRQIRAMEVPGAKTVPIIAMTANVFREDVEQTQQAGMNGHLGKPLDFDKVIATLVEYLGK
jgi:CheY-like chemotaxis protein